MPRASDVLPHGAFAAELMREMVEVHTPPLVSLSDPGDSLVANRRLATEAAAREGISVAACPPARWWPSISADGRYLEMTANFAITAREQLICGCHVHVEVKSRDKGVAVIDRIRP